MTDPIKRHHTFGDFVVHVFPRPFQPSECPFDELPRRFAEQGLQIAAGVPLMLDEGPEFRSFRIGLFGLDKLKDVPASLARLDAAFDKVFGPAR